MDARGIEACFEQRVLSRDPCGRSLRVGDIHVDVVGSSPKQVGVQGELCGCGRQDDDTREAPREGDVRYPFTEECTHQRCIRGALFVIHDALDSTSHDEVLGSREACAPRRNLPDLRSKLNRLESRIRQSARVLHGVGNLQFRQRHGTVKCVGTDGRHRTRQDNRRQGSRRERPLPHRCQLRRIVSRVVECHRGQSGRRKRVCLNFSDARGNTNTANHLTRLIKSGGCDHRDRIRNRHVGRGPLVAGQDTRRIDHEVPGGFAFDRDRDGHASRSPIPISHRRTQRTASFRARRRHRRRQRVTAGRDRSKRGWHQLPRHRAPLEG